MSTSAVRREGDRKREVGHALHAVAMHSMTRSPGADWLLPSPSAVSRWWSYLRVVLVRTLLRARNACSQHLLARRGQMRANCQNVQRRACVGRDTGVAGTYAIHSVTIRHFSSESKLIT